MNPLKKVMVAIILCIGSLHAQETETKDTLSVDTKYLDEVVVLDSRLPLKRSQSGKPLYVLTKSRLNDLTGETLPNYWIPKQEFLCLEIVRLRDKICAWPFEEATTIKY